MFYVEDFLAKHLAPLLMEKNIAEKNLWDYMLKFIKDSEAPVVFGENVVLEQ